MAGHETARAARSPKRQAVAGRDADCIYDFLQERFTRFLHWD
jgi:hypothetical protein